MTTNIKSVIFRLNSPLGRRSGGFFYTTDSYFILSSFFSIKTFFNVEFVQESGLKLQIFRFSPPPAVDGPPPKPILHLDYTARTHHSNYQQNQSKGMTTNIKSVIFRLNSPLGRRSGGFFYTTDSYFILSSFFSIKTFFNVEFVQESGLKLQIFRFSPPPRRRRRTDRHQNLFCI